MSDVARRLSEIANRDEAKVVSVRTDDLRAILNSHARLIEALEKSAEGWANAIEMGLIPPKHVTSATILRDEARKALAQAREDGE